MDDPDTKSTVPDIYSVERRFDLTTIFVVTTMCSIIFAACTLAQAPIQVPAVIIGFISLVGLSQALLFGGKYPRLASLLTGGALFFIAVVGVSLAQSRSPQSLDFVCFGLASVLFSYIAGVTAASAFYFAAQLRGLYKKSPEE